MRLISGIDTAMPDVGTKWNYHARWNQNERFWQEDFRQLADCGFDLLRWQVPWSLVQPKKNQYRWELIDSRVEFAKRLGLEIFYPIMHFNVPSWIGGKSVRHPVYAPELGELLAEYTHQLLSRYQFRLVIPIVEVQMDAFQRGWIGNWQPHQKSRAAYKLIYRNLVKAFRHSARVAHEHGATVFCSEPASEVQTVIDLGDSVDIAGIDLYPHMHKQYSVLGYFRHWWKSAGLPLCISEFGAPETYDPLSTVDDYGRFIPAGVDRHRVIQAQLLREAVARASAEGIPIPYGGWYPGMGNIGWGLALTRERKKADCDRAGLVDLSRQSDGTLQRVLCPALVKEVLALRNVGTPVLKSPPALLPGLMPSTSGTAANAI